MFLKAGVILENLKVALSSLLIADTIVLSWKRDQNRGGGRGRKAMIIRVLRTCFKTL